jgi:MFS family permease
MILNETIMSVALPALIVDLQVTAAMAQWLASGFLLTMAAAIPMTVSLAMERRASRLALRAHGAQRLTSRSPLTGAFATKLNKLSRHAEVLSK